MFTETISNSTLFSICKEIDAIDDNDNDKSVVFEPQYHGGSTMLKIFGTRNLYVGCDRNGHTTLMKSVDPTNPSPKILFHAERVAR